MNIELNEKMLFWELQSVAKNYENGEKTDFSEIIEEVNKLIHSTESCHKMINNRRRISDQDFYNMLLEFAYINEWNTYDCYSVLEMYHKIKFTGEDIIKTTMQQDVKKNEGHGRDFSWWQEKIGINFKILYTKDFNVDHKHKYTINELEKLIEEKKIIIICEEERNLGYDKDDYIPEKYKFFAGAFDDYSIKYDFFCDKGKYYLYTLKYIRKKLTTKRLKKLYSKHLNNVNYEVNSAMNYNHPNNTHEWTYVQKECSILFEEEGFIKRLKRLNEEK